MEKNPGMLKCVKVNYSFNVIAFFGLRFKQCINYYNFLELTIRNTFKCPNTFWGHYKP